MARSVSATVQAAINAQTTDNAFHVLLEITHSSFTTVRLVDNTENITSNGNVYTAFPFSLTLPADSEELAPRLRVSVVNITRDLVDEFRSVAGVRERVKCSVSVIMSNDPDVILASWPQFELTNLTYNVEILGFDLVAEDFLSEPFPGDSFSPANFPGLF